MEFNEMLRNKLIDEFDIAIEGMRDSENDVHTKLFYMSGVQGAISRTFNLDYDSSLVFAHFVLQNCFQNLSAQIAKILSGMEKVIQIEESVINKLADALSVLRDRIKENEDFYDVLERVTIITFSTTGNGFYLQKKGLL